LIAGSDDLLEVLVEKMTKLGLKIKGATLSK
jgi:hypothetical protein